MKIITFFCNITLSKIKDNLVEEHDSGVVFNPDQDRYLPFCDCAINSFKKWHKDIEVVYLNDNNIKDFLKSIPNYKPIKSNTGIKFSLGFEVMKKYNADKLIILDIDTITCARLDEIINNNEDDILVSLNYNIQDN